MAIDRRRFLALPAIGVPAMVVGKRLGILECLKSYFSALRGDSLTAENIPKNFVPLELELERGRVVARELHDSALQSLICVAMQLDVLRRRSASQVVTVAQELGRLHDLLLEEARKLHELMPPMKPLDLEAKNLRAHLTELVERFQRETGITARFVCESTVVDIRPRVCSELVQIVQEGLVRVRSHSATQHVLVRLTATDSHWQVTIEDDGRVFKDPMVIRERVRLIEGELTVESSPSRGSRLVVTVPKRPKSTIWTPAVA